MNISANVDYQPYLYLNILDWLSYHHLAEGENIYAVILRNMTLFTDILELFIYLKPSKTRCFKKAFRRFVADL